MSNIALDRLVCQLREKLLSCDASDYSQLWCQVVARHKTVDALLDDILLPDQEAIAQTATDTRCDHLLADEQLPTVLASLLGRLCSPTRPSLCTLTDRHMEALSTLMWGLRCAVTRAASILDKRPAGSPAEQFLVAVAAAHPCGALAGTMALHSRAATPAPASPLSPPPSGTGSECRVFLSRSLSLSTTAVALKLVSAAAASECVAAAFRRDPHAVQLLACACDSTVSLMDQRLGAVPEVAACVACLAHTLIDSKRFAGTQTHPAGASCSAAVRAGLLAETRVACVLQCAVLRWRWTQHVEGLGTWAAKALTVWLTAQQPNGPRSAHTVRAQEVVLAVPRADEIGAAGNNGIAEAHWAACGLLAALLASSMSPAERHRAFPAIIAYAECVADVVLGAAGAAASKRAQARVGLGGRDCSSSSSSSSSRDSDMRGRGGGDGNSGSTHVHMCEAVFRLLNTCAGHCELELLVEGNTPAPAAEVRQLRVRARWCTQHRLVGKCEALLRLLCGASGGSTALWPPQALQAAISSACHLAARTHVLLIADEQDGAAAQVAHESLLATVRKIMRALPTISNGQASAGAAGGTAGGTASGTTGGAAQWLPSWWVNTLGPAVLAFHDAATLLQLPTAVSAAALRHVALQLLWPAVRRADAFLAAGAAAAAAAVQNSRHQRVLAMLELFNCLMYLHHHAGLADVTAAAGAPLLVSSVLHRVMDASSAAPLTALPLHMASLSLVTLSILHTAIGHPAWMHAARRLALVSQAQALVAAAQHAPAPGEPLRLHEPAPMVAGMSGALAAWSLQCAEVIELNACIEALPENPTFPASTPSWDDCLLATLALPGASTWATEGPLTSSLCGCCRRRCTNLDGSSETALHLRKCGGCRLARYCSVACQRRAWRTGHRKACQAWQTRDCNSQTLVVSPCGLGDIPH